MHVIDQGVVVKPLKESVVKKDRSLISVNDKGIKLQSNRFSGLFATEVQQQAAAEKPRKQRPQPSLHVSSLMANII